MTTKIMETPLALEFAKRAKAHPFHAAGIVVGLIALIVISSIKMVERHQRFVAGDVSRATNLVQLQDSIQKYFEQTDKLPSDLSELAGEPNPNPNFQRDQYLFDPETMRPLEYKVINLRTYEVCGSFHYSSQNEDAAPPGVDQNPIWNHGGGHDCFKAFVTRDPKAK